MLATVLAALKLKYESTIARFNAAKTVEEFAEVEKQFQKLGDSSDAAKYAEQCREKSLNIQDEAAVKTLKNARDEKSCRSCRRSGHSGSNVHRRSLRIKCHH